MTEHELLRIITFLERVKAPYRQLIPIADEDENWNILLFLVRQHLSGLPVTLSSLASVAGVPYATAVRRIHELIDTGHIVRKPVGKTGRSFALSPSAKLLESFTEYARRIKSLLAETFGLRSRPEDEESFYFGGSYFAAQILPPPQLIATLFRGQRELK